MNAETEVELTGLEGTNPLGLLAALGVLSELEHAGRQPTLRWTDDLVPQAVVVGGSSVDDITAILDGRRSLWLTGAVLGWPAEAPLDDAKLPSEELRDWALHVADLGDRGAGDLWAALVAEGAKDNSAKAKPTHLHFTAGQQRFLLMARELATSVDRSQLEESLVGPWRYASTLPSFAWDARGERIYALRGYDPSKQKRLGIPGADWLAFLGLSCFPVINQRGRLITTGCDREWKRSALRWPLWRVPLGISTIRSLLRTGWQLDQLRPGTLAARGILRVLEAPIRRTDQGGYGSFGAASVIAEASAAGR